MAVATAEEVARFIHQSCVVRFRDVPDAGRGTTLDLVLQAGSGAAGEFAVSAPAQRERTRRGIPQIGRAWCRARVGQFVSNSVGPASVKKKKNKDHTKPK